MNLGLGGNREHLYDISCKQEFYWWHVNICRGILVEDWDARRYTNKWDRDNSNFHNKPYCHLSELSHSRPLVAIHLFKPILVTTLLEYIIFQWLLMLIDAKNWHGLQIGATTQIVEHSSSKLCTQSYVIKMKFACRIKNKATQIYLG
jgi:hypothetical protein